MNFQRVILVLKESAEEQCRYRVYECDEEV